MGSRPNTHIDTGTHGYMGTLKKDGDMSGTKKARGGLSLTHLMIRTQVTLIQTDTADKQDA